MCEPTTWLMIGSLALSAAGTAYQVNEGNRAANAQQAALEDQAQADRDAATIQAGQIADNAAEAMNERNKAAIAEAAMFDLITGEFGGGATAERGSNVISLNQHRDLATIRSNRDQELAQISREGVAINSRLRHGVAAIGRPSAVGAALTIAGQAGGAYLGYASRPNTTGDQRINYSGLEDNSQTGAQIRARR